MYDHQSSSDSSDDSMDNPPAMKSSPGHHRRRNSMDELDMLSDVKHLKEELNKLHEKTSPECQEHLKKMNNLVNEFEKDYSYTVQVFRGIAATASAAAIMGVVFTFFTAGVSLVAAGIAAAAAAVAVKIALAIGDFRKNQQEKNTRKQFEDELTELQKKISPLIDLLNKIFDRVQEILRNPTISEQKAKVIRDRFSNCFEQMRLFQTDDNRRGRPAVSERLRLTQDISETFADMSRLLELLEEILEDGEEQTNRPTERPADTTAGKKIEKEFKEKAEKFINEMRKGINQLENTMNEIDKTKNKLGNTNW